MRLFANFVAFQIGWFACVLGGANQLPWLGAVAALVVVAFHLWQLPRPVSELSLILTAMVLGAVLDSLPVALGLVEYPAGMVFSGLAPYWIIAMWALFATTLNISLSWLKGRFVLAAVLGAIAGPLAYYGGSKLGGMVFLEPKIWGLGILALNWSVAMPLLVYLSERFNGADTTGARYPLRRRFAP
jgi:hypothetical protein